MSNDQSNSHIVLYQPNESITLEVKVDAEHDTVWLSIDQMALLFGRDKSVIGKHVRAVFKEGELTKDSVWAKFAYTASDGKTYQVDFYNLDVVISVGYRVKSPQGTQFRIWANKVIRNYLLQGFNINHHLIALQERTDKRFQHLEQRLDKQQQQIDFFIRTNVPPIEGIFYEGQVLDARLFVEQLIRIARQEVILVDNYIDARTFDILQLRNPDVKASIYVERVGRNLQALQQTAEKQYGRDVALRETSQRIHDRFLIIDEEVYHLGASLNELGKRLFAFSRLHIGKEAIVKTNYD
ncbi:MAG: RhuM family protein [Bacteroidia bacterium]|nr:RhuM family protein [Bacteroidia bacterium]